MNDLRIAAKNWARWIGRYGILFLAFVVSANQLRLRFNGMTSWKGGGFGMYAELHPVYNKVFVKARSSFSYTADSDRSFERVNEIMARTQMYPSEDRLDRLKQEYAFLYGQNEYLVEVWKPVYDPDSGLFHLRLDRSY